MLFLHLSESGPLNPGVASLLGVIAGGILVWVILRVTSGNIVSRARQDGEQIRQTARTEAEAERQRIELEAEKRIAARREELDQELAALLADVKKDQARLEKREDTLDQKLEKINETERRLEKRESRIRKLEEAAEAREQELTAEIARIRARLESLSGLSVEEAKAQFLDEIRIEYAHDGAVRAQRIIEEAELQARTRSREITLQAIQRYAAEHVADSTVRSVKIPSDDLKGRIIGREGRNIRTLEKATGVDILVDDTPGVIAVSCFDPIRRQIAAESLQRLVADGRVHPSRIEEIVESVRKDMAERIIKAGNEAALEANVRGLHPKVVEALGKLHFRTSYGQNVLRHSIEVAYLSQIIADQLGLKGDLARRCGLLHDIGKAMDHEMEGGHPAIGMEFAARHGEKSDVVLNAIGGHHGDIVSTSPYTPIVMAADAISGARPGARRESMEMYIKRLEQLEAIARESRLVTEAHAFQAGREVRVIIDAQRCTDADAFALSEEIAKKVSDEMTFPGEIKVTVLREVRAEAVAR
ncbi:MAG: ribonuclease Y [Phycisphaeraceae bacterium]|nr:ribonuclease Y [Phycisphaeraceae bacterium]